MHRAIRTRAESFVLASSVKPIRQFQLFVDDDRYTVPSVRFLSARDIVSALAVADRLIDESSHHRGVEVCENGRRLFGLGSCARMARSGEDEA